MTTRLPALWQGLLFLFLFLLNGYITRAQIIPDSITIVRDKWGVPHIYAATDEAVSYGLAWAAAEDDFATIQESFLSTKGKLSEVKGKEGAIMDIIVHLIGADKLVEDGYDASFSSKFKKVLDGYAAGINSYAAKHPKEVLLKGVFPITGKDIIKGYVMPFTFITSVHYSLGRIFKGQLKDYEAELPGGSNAFAISKNKTTDGKTYLVINSHQPLEGAFAWYEAHLVSDEGLNILGSNFPGGVTLFSGVNEHLGWAHTLNYPDFSDVYKLSMHPKEKYKYRFDGKWEMLEERKIKLRVKMGFIKIPVTKKFYWSKYGATIKNKDGFYSIRFPANMDIRGAEQWYRMNKAQNFKEFKQALEMQAFPGTNIIYADRDDNIFYISNGQFPYRNPNYDWKKVLPGDTSATLWDTEYYPLDSLPQLLNPSCGYVFNTNNTPFNATCEDGNLNADDYNRTMGFQTKDNNRSRRFQHLISQYDKLSYQDLKKIKYDLSFTDPVYSPSLGDIEQIMHLDAVKYPGIKETIELIKHWDRRADKESTAASTFSLAVHYIFRKLLDEGRLPGINTVSEQTFADALEYAQKHLKKHFGTIHVPLGELQLHVRGDKEYPMAGLPDVLAAMHVEPYKKGRLKTLMGESYIQLVRFSENGVELETVNAYGASNRKESPHYTDQMELFVNQKLKKMTLDKSTIFKEAESIYHPE